MKRNDLSADKLCRVYTVKKKQMRKTINAIPEYQMIVIYNDLNNKKVDET